MNSHFQSSETTWTSSGFLSDAIGTAGSSWCEPTQAMPPRNMMVSSGTAQTTSSIAAGVGPVRPVRGFDVGRPVPPGKGDRGQHGRHDDGQHDDCCVNQDDAFGAVDRTSRIEHAPGAARQRQARADRSQAKYRAAMQCMSQVVSRHQYITTASRSYRIKSKTPIWLLCQPKLSITVSKRTLFYKRFSSTMNASDDRQCHVIFLTFTCVQTFQDVYR